LTLANSIRIDREETVATEVIQVTTRIEAVLKHVVTETMIEIHRWTGAVIVLVRIEDGQQTIVPLQPLSRAEETSAVPTWCGDRTVFTHIPNYYYTRMLSSTHCTQNCKCMEQLARIQQTLSKED